MREAKTVGELTERSRQQFIRAMGRFSRRMAEIAAAMDSGAIAREVRRV